jgi:hypothetical protein
MAGGIWCGIVEMDLAPIGAWGDCWPVVPEIWKAGGTSRAHKIGPNFKLDSNITIGV